MLVFSCNMASKHKIDRSGVSGMSFSGGIDTKFEYLALLDPLSGGHFYFMLQ